MVELFDQFVLGAGKERTLPELGIFLAVEPALEEVAGENCSNCEEIERHQHVGDLFDRRARDPAVLLLRPHQQRNDRRLLAAGGVFLDRLVRPDRILIAEGECGRLELIFG